MDKLFGGPVAANDNAERVCPMCGDAVTGSKSKKFCCAKCRRANERLNRDLDKERLRKAELSPERVCEHCGSTFRRRSDSKNAARFCSRQCGFDAGSNISDAQRLRSLAASMIVSFTVKVCCCIACGAHFRAASLGEKYCGQQCRDKINRERYIAANDNGRDRSERPCAECGTTFSPQYGDMRRIFCSSDCSARKNRRVKRKKDRARMRGAFVENVDPLVVFDRDGWVCRECGCATPREKRGTYDADAPELDHIMPLSLGGAHSYMNTQCLCRSCNAKKGNTPPNQVSLFAYG